MDDGFPRHHCADPPAHRAYGLASTTMRHPSSQRFMDNLDLQGETHDRKQLDYGSDTDPFYNVRASESFGIPAWVGAVLRASDKMRRLEKAARQVLDGEAISMANEGVEDSLLDLAVYANIGLTLFQESNDPPDLEGSFELASRQVRYSPERAQATIRGPLSEDDPAFAFTGDTDASLSEPNLPPAITRERNFEGRLVIERYLDEGVPI